MRMAYDESGNRVWERKSSRGGGLDWDRVTIPGFGTYNKSHYTDFELERLELVGGGFRNGQGAEAVYPLMDAQGNVRAYAGLSGIKTAYDYRPFGRENALAEGMEGDVDNRRWQDKEYDGEHGKYFFGARYFDPFFGLWMTPDPAGQYANPYTYGGDPVNFIDPTGLLSLNTGFFTIGWDSNRGWNFGMSAGMFSYSWYQNGSKTFEATIGGSYQWTVFNFGAELGYSYNTYSGHSVSAGAHVCVGAKEDEAGACAGLEAGGSMYWDAYGNFLGATAYVGPFAELQADDKTSLLKVNGGYETGLFGMEGRGWYTGVSAMDGSLYANWSQNGDWSYGFSKKFQAWEYSDHGPVSRIKLFGGLIDHIGGDWAADLYDVKDPIINDKGYGDLLLDLDETDLTIMVHGIKGSGNVFVEGMVRFEGIDYTAEEFFDQILTSMDLKNIKKITLYSCSSGAGGDYSFAQKLANVFYERTKQAVTVRAPTQDIYASRTKIFTEVFFKSKIGMWLDFTPQQRYQYDRGF